MASPRQALCVFAIFFMHLVSFTSAQLEIWYSDCSVTGNYSSNSIYKSNLSKLLSSLASTDEINYGFYNISEGQNTDEVNVIALCRGDRNLTVCRNCLNASIHDLPERCPNEKEAIIWYEDCMLRYSNRPIFNSPESQPSHPWTWTSTITDPAQFNEALNSLLAKLKDDAASGDSTRKFAVGQVTTKLSQSLYAYVQCTPDLSKIDCGNCLDKSFNWTPAVYGASGGGNVYPSCSYRYETFKFYDTQSAQAPLAPPHPTVSPAPTPTPTGLISAKGNGGISWRTITGIIVPTGLAFLAISVLLFCFICMKRKGKYDVVSKENASDSDIPTAHSLLFDLQTIQAATNNFSIQNKIGAGGFGNVYEGVLLDGQRVAVKRLSRSSGQGEEEFKNEIVLIAKLQHRNLARLLGFCLDGGEKILVYEFVPNKSLDCILFDPEKCGKLNWSTRYKIIQGIARGLLYLHQDSRLRIIHRDLKASNILLDNEMNPKISDFGMARIFGGDESQAMTNRIVGTYGYMSPEYAMLGQFSIKSDVYSFGVMVLEIVTGRRNSAFNQSDGAEDLLSYAWKRWCNGTPLELMDPTLKDSYSRNEVIQCIHVGLLCVQEGLVDRPTMASVVLMLNSFSMTMRQPREPALLFRSGVETSAQMRSLESVKSFRSSQASMITDVYPR